MINSSTLQWVRIQFQNSKPSQFVMVYVLSHRIDPSAMKKVEIVDQPPINSSQQSNPRDNTFWQSAMQSSQPMDQPPINSSQQSNPRDSTFWQSTIQSSQPMDQPPIHSSQQSNQRDSIIQQFTLQPSNYSVPPSDTANIRRSYQSYSSHDNSQAPSLRSSSVLPSVPNDEIIDNTASIRRSLKKEDNGNANPE
mgnify:CR=1 FL=1